MSPNTIYFGENEKTLGFTTLVAKLFKSFVMSLKYNISSHKEAMIVEVFY